MRYAFVLSTLFAMALSASAHATVITEGDKSISLAYNPGVQIIQGDKILKAPIPSMPTPTRLYAEAAVDEDGKPVQEITSLINQYNNHMSASETNEIAKTIHSLCQSYQLDPRLLVSLVAVESSFRPTAVSRTGAMGLGQLKPATAKWLGVSNAFDPRDNLGGVAKYLRYLLDRYEGSVPHALAAYFQGQGTIDRQGIDSGAEYYISKINRVFVNF